MSITLVAVGKLTLLLMTVSMISVVNIKIEVVINWVIVKWI